MSSASAAVLVGTLAHLAKVLPTNALHRCCPCRKWPEASRGVWLHQLLRGFGFVLLSRARTNLLSFACRNLHNRVMVLRLLLRLIICTISLRQRHFLLIYLFDIHRVTVIDLGLLLTLRILKDLSISCHGFRLFLSL